jgi:hypothetical protein
MHVAHIHIHLVEPTIIYNCNNDTCTYLSKYHLIDFSIHLHLASFASSVVSPALLLWITSAWISTTIHNWYTAMLLALLYKNKRELNLISDSTHTSCLSFADTSSSTKYKHLLNPIYTATIMVSALHPTSLQEHKTTNVHVSSACTTNE